MTPFACWLRSQRELKAANAPEATLAPCCHSAKGRRSPTKRRVVWSLSSGKMDILHRKNSLFYKTRKGAQMGDLFMSLIHPGTAGYARRRVI